MPASIPSRTRANRGECGFLLMGTGVLIIVIVAMLSALGFVSNRESRFKSNYAAGERVAELATSAHFYAQTRRYGPSGTVDAPGTLLFNSASGSHPDFNPPDGFNFRSVSGIKYEVEIRALNDAPITSTVSASLKAASAYMQIKVRIPAGKSMTPSDRIAFLSGATKRGMSRVAFVDTNIPAGDICDGSATRVRWGPESSACLNGPHIAALGFADVQPGDIIVPVWETALTKATDKMIYRYRQPERPDLNSMNTAMLMGGTAATGNAINNAQKVLGDNIIAAGTSTIQDMTVRYGSPTALNGGAVIDGQPLRVYNQDAPAAPSMNVSGPVTFNAGGGADSLNIGNTLAYATPAKPLNVTSANNVGVDVVKSEPGSAITIEPIGGGPLNVAVENFDPMSNMSSLTMVGAAAKMAVTGNLDATSANIDSPYGTNIYGANMTFRNTDSNIMGTPAWNIDTLEQKGSGASNYLRIVNGVVTAQDCYGNGCADFVRDAPPNPY